MYIKLHSVISPFNPFVVHLSLKLKAAIVSNHDEFNASAPDSFLLACADGTPTLVPCRLRDTDAGHAQFAVYVVNKAISNLDDAVKHFQLVMDQ
jgi:hypothetical protein